MQDRHRQFASARIMIMAAPNGARRMKSEHPALPLTAGELADCAQDLLAAGVSVLHLHVRDSAGRHTLDADIYRTAIRRIRRRTGEALVLQATTEAAGRYSAAQQMALVRDLKPEAVSIALREICPDVAAEPGAGSFFDWLARERIWPQYIVYTPAELQRFESLRRRGLFSAEHPSCLLVLGRYAAGQYGNAAELEALLAAVDCRQFPWTACCFGPGEHGAMLAAAEQGGHVRLGFENNLYLADGSPARDNAALVAQFTAAIAGAARQPATADEVRNVFPGGTS